MVLAAAGLLERRQLILVAAEVDLAQAELMEVLVHQALLF
jgi:hypothetical protein